MRPVDADYLETRSDIDQDRLAYLGVSMGRRMGGIMLAIEPRFKVGVLLIPGFSSLPVLPEVDPFNFTSRITQPVLMTSGRYDQVFPLETAALPMFRALTSAADKRHIISETGHAVSWNVTIAETLAWLDKYLGPVE